jgi:hypothetical protein
MEQTNIGVLEEVDLPLFALRAALTCASTEESRYYLNGVYVHAIDDEYRIVASDGHRLFVYSTPVESERRGAEVPVWMRKGVIVSAEGLKERLTLLDKLEYETARVAYQVSAPHIVISDPTHSCTFKVKPVDGTFSDYQRILDNVSFEARELGEMASVSFDTGYLKDVGALAKMLGAKSARVFGGDSTNPTGDASLITFPECPFAVLVLMPLRHSETRLGVGVAKVMIGAVNGTVSALKAHQTRWANKIATAKGNAKKAAENKVAEYDKRIAAVLAAANALPALPAPAGKVAPAGAEGQGYPWTDHRSQADAEIVSYAIAQAVDPEAPLPGQADLAAYRRGLKAAAAKRALARFYADTNAVLSAQHEGLTLSQLADGVPIDDWYDAGLEPEEAASRCLDWRRIGTVLPADEVGPGEADFPVGLLQSGARPQIAASEAEREVEPYTPPIGDAGTQAAHEAAVLAATAPKRKTKLEREFDAFRAQVSAIIEARKGVGLDDLVDCPMRDWFERGVSAKAAASKAIRFNNNS